MVAGPDVNTVARERKETFIKLTKQFIGIAKAPEYDENEAKQLVKSLNFYFENDTLEYADMDDLLDYFEWLYDVAKQNKVRTVEKK